MSGPPAGLADPEDAGAASDDAGVAEEVDETPGAGEDADDVASPATLAPPPLGLQAVSEEPIAAAPARPSTARRVGRAEEFTTRTLSGA
jgi:hypothetical protein